MDPTNASAARMLGAVLEHISAVNGNGSQVVTPFHCEEVAPISLCDYMERMETYMGCSEECFCIASVLITRLEATFHRCSVISPLSVHRLALTSVVVAIKIHEDQCYSNQHYADVGGIPLSELNDLEAYLLKQLNWHVVVPQSQFESCHSALSSLFKSIHAASFATTDVVVSCCDNPSSAQPKALIVQ